MYENKLEFPGGRGMQNKKTFCGGAWVFSGTAQCMGGGGQKTLHGGYGYFLELHILTSELVDEV